MLQRPLFTALGLLLLPGTVVAQVRHRAVAAVPDPWAALLLPTHHAPAPTSIAITATDLKTRLFIFSADSMQGRRVGTAGNVKGVEYIAREAKKIGLLPAGQDGTYFQNVDVPIDLRTFDSSATLSAGGTTLTQWVDFIPRDLGATVRSLNGTPVIFGGNWVDSSTVISDAEGAGKVVVITSSVSVPPNPPGIPQRFAVAAHFRSAAGIAVVGVEQLPAATIAAYRLPTNGLRHTDSVPAYLYINRRAAEALLGGQVDGMTKGTAGRTVVGNVRIVLSRSTLPLPEPLRNVVALVPGSDPTLRSEFVVLGAHSDHLGTISLAAELGMSDVQQPMPHDSIYVVDHLFRKGGADDPAPVLTAAQQREVNAILQRVRLRSHGRSARLDSTFNGADDDGSGSVSLLEIAQYFAGQPVKPKRSLLFVWHVGEEAGLWGSEYFTNHPTVPRDAIIAELNMDMVGRGSARDQTGRGIDGTALHGGPGYIQVVGSRRLSTELGDIVERVNRSGHHGLHFDYHMDADGHPQNIYCRSDHENYARWGIPVAFFTTGGHADYHQVTDEPQYIDYDRMAQVDNFVTDLARHVANLDHRVTVDHPKPDPNGVCKQ